MIRRPALPASFLAACAMLAFTAVCQAEASRTWHFTGVELVAALQGKMPNQFQAEAQSRLYSSAYGQAYIAGIADQTQGAAWCTSTGVLPHELSDRVYTYLSGLPAARLSGNAGPLVGEALAQSFPCKQTR